MENIENIEVFELLDYLRLRNFGSICDIFDNSSVKKFNVLVDDGDVRTQIIVINIGDRDVVDCYGAFGWLIKAEDEFKDG